MSKYTKEQLEQMLEDVVNVLELSDGAIDKHGHIGTPPAEIVKSVLEEKDRQITMLKCGMKQLEGASTAYASVWQKAGDK